MEARQAELEATNRDLAEELKSVREMKERFGATGEVDFKPPELQKASEQFGLVKELARRSLDDAFSKRKGTEVYLLITPCHMKSACVLALESTSWRVGNNCETWLMIISLNRAPKSLVGSISVFPLEVRRDTLRWYRRPLKIAQSFFFL